ncbi:SAM-dependent methyltransferase [Bradyrhizobium sp. LLZ17]|uniref:site-specific DNA-methyltransferase (adenine-specific) n=1 Tax=Bradyrhizobium sp. LLZ17 TaxID=3239388 RepID=A0AB39XFZ3_9BRAD
MAIALDRAARSILRTAITGNAGSRRVAEDGARKSLTELGLEEAKRPTGLSSAQTELRNRLRAHARSLGDIMVPDGSIKAKRLVGEIAYEHWHRALFARFLAENGLLVDPDHKIAISLDELEQIAKEEGKDPIELAADWAEPMLPQIFRRDDPVLALSLPPETKAGILEIIRRLPRAVFLADDSLGWAYQFWQADNKEQINKSEVKIGADELPAVTQLFTEDYMVLFLLENTLGAWWAAKRLAAEPALAAEANSEDELRDRTSPAGYRWTYLRFLREPQDGEPPDAATGPWCPAAGAFLGWEREAKDIAFLDPCMGSGHFLVFALPILAALRRAEEGLDERAAIRAVLAENLYGLEIDPRCTQIAAFTLALTSWKRLGAPEPLPSLSIACSGLSIGFGREEFLKLADRIADAEGWGGHKTVLDAGRSPLGERAATRIRGGLERIYDLFKKAPYLGSLIDPRKAVTGGDHGYGSLMEERYDVLADHLHKALDKNGEPAETRETTVTAEGLAKAAEIMARRYTLVATNVPYLGNGDMDLELKTFVEENYKRAKSDLSTVFIDRARQLVAPSGALAVVFPQNCLFLPTYKSFRLNLLDEVKLEYVVALGEEAWETFAKRGPLATLACLTNHAPTNKDRHFSIDATVVPEIEQKIARLKECQVTVIDQEAQRNNPDHRILTETILKQDLLEAKAVSLAGILNGDSDKFTRLFWEFPRKSSDWAFLQTSPSADSGCRGLIGLIYFDEQHGHLREDATVRKERLHNSDQRGNFAWHKRGIAVGQMRDLPIADYFGEKFDSNVAVIVPKLDKDFPAIYEYCHSPDFREDARRLEKRKNITNATFGKTAFNYEHWQRIAVENHPGGLPKPYSNDPTQWLFEGHPRGSRNPNASLPESFDHGAVTSGGPRPGMAEHPLQVAVLRLLGYRWPRQTNSSFMDCPAISEPDEAGRSTLIANDGIVSLSATADQPDATTRLRELIRLIWGADYVDGTIRQLLAVEDAKANDLSTWLADEFFEGHCKLFHQTPFIWQVWDGVRGGFSALINYHQLSGQGDAGRRLLEKLRDTYLGDWLAAQRRALAAGEAGTEERLTAAEHLRSELTRIIEGEPPYDIFVRWKPLYRQPIGWEPDIEDGVRLNIRPFLIARTKNPRGRDACILRITPRVKKYAGADRGVEPLRKKEEFPWFWAEDADVAKVDFAGGPEFKGRRYNDFHFSRAFKQRARDARGKRS